MSKTIKNINNKGSIIFSCDPYSNELNIFTGLQFYLNTKTHLFEIDQNPDEDRELIDIDSLNIADNFSSMSIECNYRGKEHIFNIHTITEKEKLIVKFIHENHGLKSDFLNKKYQYTSYTSEIFVKREITLKSKYKNIEKPYGYLFISIEKNKVFYIIPSPWKKLRVESFDLSDNDIALKTNDGIYKFSFFL